MIYNGKPIDLTPEQEEVGNFRVEPPGLFCGRGDHPKMGKLKKCIRPRDITINIGKGAPVLECSIPGERWKEVKHDNTVTWLAFWNEPINPKEFKYVFLAARSSLKGQSDKEKYEKARLLKLLGIVFNILRENNPKLAGDRRRTVMRLPQVLREGTKKTVFVNFMDLCKMYVELNFHWILIYHSVCQFGHFSSLHTDSVSNVCFKLKLDGPLNAFQLLFSKPADSVENRSGSIESSTSNVNFVVSETTPIYASEIKIDISTLGFRTGYEGTRRSPLQIEPYG
ncbi:hypothetical protein IFM89_027988 [Coptis chinensis]|uniref:DNA topoisomerase I eukaryotic-type domain-containing protein n=1 Tax=Coptis chinensis TaxID=261450 RepID=A0A835H197_9MAGN|nr:hypothetical protein IFM89_027988 [Coptis chinensis]